MNKQRSFKIVFATLITVSLALTSMWRAWADDEMDDGEDQFILALGGRAYDNWMGLLDQHTLKMRNLDRRKFLSNHPAYPKEGRKRGLTTWRCKECHGWDYKGVDGAYGSGSHYTGIKGVRAYENKDPSQIINIIRDERHGYSEKMIDDETAQALALFIAKGQVDMDRYIDRASKKFIGTAANGTSYYMTICAMCHGVKGFAINFKTADHPEYLGTVANKNPWEAFHKIRNGHPGKEMVSMRAVDVQVQVDILAYTQGLPVKK
ncbi:MAG: hypothetical protein HQL54_05770 [Magnetococcales bacterium]|nr:hypothetical protein [Magnetococcales bacterium]